MLQGIIWRGCNRSGSSTVVVVLLLLAVVVSSSCGDGCDGVVVSTRGPRFEGSLKDPLWKFSSLLSSLRVMATRRVLILVLVKNFVRQRGREEPNPVNKGSNSPTLHPFILRLLFSCCTTLLFPFLSFAVSFPLHSFSFCSLLLSPLLLLFFLLFIYYAILIFLLSFPSSSTPSLTIRNFLLFFISFIPLFLLPFPSSFSSFPSLYSSS